MSHDRMAADGCSSMHVHAFSSWTSGDYTFHLAAARSVLQE